MVNLKNNFIKEVNKTRYTYISNCNQTMLQYARGSKVVLYTGWVGVREGSYSHPQESFILLQFCYKHIGRVTRL